VKCTGWIALNEVRGDLSTKTEAVDCMSLNTVESNSWLLGTGKRERERQSDPNVVNWTGLE